LDLLELKGAIVTIDAMGLVANKERLLLAYATLAVKKISLKRLLMIANPVMCLA